jgi:hypothetical protein
MSDLEQLDNYNSRRRRQYFIAGQQLHNGIACPQCGQELYDDSVDEVLTSYPPQKRIHCINLQCKYRGTRVV